MRTIVGMVDFTSILSSPASSLTGSIMMSSLFGKGLATCGYWTLSLGAHFTLTYVFDRTKLSLSHALSQSVKISLVSISVYQSSLLPPLLRIDGFEFACRCRALWCPLWTYFLFFQFEALISSTIEDTKDIPEIISETGKIGMPHKGVISLHISTLNPV